jgi:hypothetical protein
MKCPACFNQLKALTVGSWTVDVCESGCGGIWFDAFELQRVDEKQESVGDALLHIRRDERIVADPARKRECPRCDGIKLHRHFFSARRRVEVDQCPNCNGYWLDAGELAQIRAEQMEKACREESGSVSADFIRYLYRLEQQSRKANPG